jgi:hypothetical protein
MATKWQLFKISAKKWGQIASDPMLSMNSFDSLVGSVSPMRFFM